MNNRGIYILGNDKVFEQTMALVNSLKYYDSEIKIIMIPYDNRYQKLARTLKKLYDIKIYQNLEIIAYFSRDINRLFGNKVERINLLRKLLCWFGELDEFLYLDTDIIVFQKIIKELKFLEMCDFFSCDYQYKNGINQVFCSKIIEDNILTIKETKNTFNSGFWGSKKNIISYDSLYKTLRYVADNSKYFFLANPDQTILNYLVLKEIGDNYNIAKKQKNIPGSWAGSCHFKQSGNILIDPNTNKKLKYLHWAGIKIKKGSPYWNIWKYYRTLTDK